MPGWLVPLITILLYLAALSRQSLAIFGHKDDDRPLVLTLGGCAVLLHAWMLSQAIWSPQGLDLGFMHVAELAFWMVALLITLGAVRFSVIVLIPPVYLCALLIIPIAKLVSTSHITTLDHGLSLHIAIALLTYTLMLIAGLYGILLRIVDIRLKRHRINQLPKSLPPLMTMERHLFQLLLGGWLFLTLTLLSGWRELDNLLAQHQAHKLFFSLAAWLCYSLLLAGHQLWGWRGRRSQWLNYVGLLLLTLGYFGSRLVLDLILGGV